MKISARKDCKKNVQLIISKLSFGTPRIPRLTSRHIRTSENGPSPLGLFFGTKTVFTRHTCPSSFQDGSRRFSDPLWAPSWAPSWPQDGLNMTPRQLQIEKSSEQ